MLVKTNVLTALCALFVLAACGEEVKSVEYYSQHKTEAELMMNTCGSEGASARKNCMNASEGRALMFKRLEQEWLQKQKAEPKK